jgi:ferredoxin-NADP reductase
LPRRISESLSNRYQARAPGMGPAVTEELERNWKASAHYGRRAEVTRTERVTETGTVRIWFRVIDGEDFSFLPGRFVGIEAKVAGFGYRRSPYCILSRPNDQGTFELLVRVVPDGPLSQYLGELQVGDVISFRGPTGRSMIPKDADTELILLATGVGISPFISLASTLLAEGFDRPIRLFWGLRLQEDICLLDELEELVRTPGRFSYQISLSRPPDGWTGLRGRLTESVPPLIDRLGDKQFYLVGNGAMNREMFAVLSDLGVAKQRVYEEHYFNPKHTPDPRTVEAIKRRFRANDLFSPSSHQAAGGWVVETKLWQRRS